MIYILLEYIRNNFTIKMSFIYYWISLIKFSLFSDCSTAPTDVIFLVDDSDSLKDDDFKKELLFVNQLINFFDLGPNLYQVGVSTFSSDVHTYLKLGSTNDKTQIFSTVGNISPSRGMTFLGKALTYILREGFNAAGGSRNDAAKVIFCAFKKNSF